MNLRLLIGLLFVSLLHLQAVMTTNLQETNKPSPWKTESGRTSCVALSNTGAWQLSGLADKNVKCLDEYQGTLYAASFGAGIFVSLDNGKTWAARNTGLNNLNVFTVLVTNKGTYAGTKDGLYFSTDDGKTWEQRSEGMPVDTRIYKLSSHHGKIYAGSRNGVFISTDQGKTWSLKNSGLPAEPYVYSIAHYNDRTYIGTQGHGLFSSTGDHQTWLQVGEGIEAGQTIGDITVHRDQLICATDGAGIYTAASGTNWQGDNRGLVSLKTFSFTQDADRIYLATLSGVYVKKAPGTIWSPLTAHGLPENAVVNNLLLLGNKLFAATEKGIFLLIIDPGPAIGPHHVLATWPGTDQLPGRKNSY
jgi:photosystem II stability/assembly factor-like uncharacterized protein